ncbi:response regulator transcription factor [Adlercreutzia faecimuris]|uniref:Helix-turn-helix transcriptional regulator n=1 Tax=Adlercreutzia faecimuris TaxID=2897341 RepID=A0ABS9WIA8_9ACTN|nr:helix-turn-helix transcriptional regulator [Adlercreutzia sp. JBNU-10]
MRGGAMRSVQACLALTLLLTASAIMSACLFPAMAAVSPLARDVSTVAGAAFALVVAVAAQRRPALLRERAITLAMFALLVLSMVLLGVGVGRWSPVLVLAGSPFGGMALIWFSVLAGVALTRIERWRCAIVVPLALVLSGLARIALFGVGEGIGLPAAMVLYVSCIGGAYLLIIPLIEQLLGAIAAGEPPLVLDVTNPSSYLPATSVVYVTAFLFQLANGYALGQHDQALPLSESLVALAPVGVVLVWAVSRRGRGLSCDGLERGAALVVIAGLLLTPIALMAGVGDGSWRYAAAALLHSGSDCFTVLLYYLIASVGARNPLGALVTSATMLAADWLGMVSGVLLMGACRALAVGDPLLMMVMTAFVAFVFIACHLTVLARFSFDGAIASVVPLDGRDPEGEGPGLPWAGGLPCASGVGGLGAGRTQGALSTKCDGQTSQEADPVSLDAGGGSVALEGVEAGEERLEAACVAVAAAYGLTTRELDVLRLLARGRTSPVIQERLVVSHNAVKSHVRHIYAKMGVHSQQQLIDVVEARKETGTAS